MRQRPPSYSVLCNFESKLALLVASLGEVFRDPNGDPTNLVSVVDHQITHIAEYRYRLRSYNARQHKKRLAKEKA